MAELRVNRKLAAILSADVVGYSRLMADDEAATVDTIKQYRAATGRVIERHKGRIVDAPGDNILAEFASAVEAVQAAVEIQRSIEGRNIELPENRRMQFRIGLNLGDVIEEDDGTIYGDGVNIAARMEALADEGGICISSTIHDAVEGKLDFGFDFLGERPVKNIEKPVRVYRVRAEQTEATDKPRQRLLVPVLAGTTAVVAIALAASLIWWLEKTTPEDAHVEAAAADPVLALPAGPVIAVLPFENLSGDPEQDYFADGITDEIITGLTRFRDLFVIGRNLSFQYKDQSVDLRKIGEVLGARYMVDGTVRRAAGTIRISVQLTDAISGANLWAESYDRVLDAGNILAVQDEITNQIVSAVADPRGVISRAELSQSERTGTENLASYECVLRARQSWRLFSVDEHLRARECLERAVDIDPDYAAAWAWLAEIYLFEFGLGYNPQPDQPDPLLRAFEASRRAVNLDARNQIGHYTLAQVYFHQNDLEAFHEETEIALNLNPNNAHVLGTLGYFKGGAGQWEIGASLAKKANTLNPYSATWLWVITTYNYHFSRKEYDEALAVIKNWDNPNLYWVHANLAAAYGHLGDTENSQIAVARLLELYPEFGNSARHEVEIWIRDKDWVDDWLGGLRKAGLNIPDEPNAAN